MSLTVTYKGQDIIDETADCVKVMKTQGKYLEDDVTIDYTGGTAPTLISKSINENGTYNASSDNADGYSSVTVNVPSDPYEKANEIMAGTIQYFKSKTAGSNIPFGGSASNTSYFQVSNLRYYSVPNCTMQAYQDYKLRNLGGALSDFDIFCCIGKPNAIQSYFMQYGRLGTMVIKTTTQVPSLNREISLATGSHPIFYVPDSMKTSYKEATNWSNYADDIFGYSDAPTYDAAATYKISSVCTYNGHFYAYCKEDFTTSTGNAPSGTADDNIYWDYIDDIEV